MIVKVAWAVLSLILFLGILTAFHSCSKVEQTEATFVEKQEENVPQKEETEAHEETVVRELPDTGGV